MEPNEKTDCDKRLGTTPKYLDFPIVIVGGGISGVSCLQQLALSAPEKDVILISASSLVTTTTNVKVLTKTLTQFDVEERKIDWLETIHPKVKVVHARVVSFDPSTSRVDLSAGGPIFYSRLCICTGATPKGLPGIPGATANPFVVGVRDAATAAELRRRVGTSRRVLVTGNGGIASEVAYGLSGVQVIWVVRDHHINAAFIDPGAAAYLESNLREKKKAKAENDRSSADCSMPSASTENGKPFQPTWKIIRSNVTKESTETEDGIFGSALGPDWQNDFPLHGAVEGCESLHIEYSCEIARLMTPEEVKMEAVELFEWGEKDGVSTSGEGTAKGLQVAWPVYVMLTNGRCFGCDLVVAGTGVVPNSAPFLGVSGGPRSCSLDGNGLMVDIRLRTTTDRVFAAGDVVTAAWPNRSKHWLQMRLWTQARVMGFHVGRCIAVSLQREMKAIAEGMAGGDAEGDEDNKEPPPNRSLDSQSTAVEQTDNIGDNVQLPTVNVQWKEDDYNVTIEDDENLYDFCFELFSHVTRFFGCRTILLGLFNGQGLGKEYEVVLRVGGGEYVKVIVGRDGRMAGAVLIGDTDLEETFENLILSGLDVSAYGEDLLHPGVDIEDYFD